MGLRKFLLSSFLILSIVLFPTAIKASEDINETSVSTYIKDSSSEKTSNSKNESTVDVADSDIEKSDEDFDSTKSTDSSVNNSEISEGTVEIPQDEEADFGIYADPQNRSDLGGSTQYNRSRASYSIPSVSATNQNTPSKSFVDISSHNGEISVNDFLNMKKYGVAGVVVKLTEATSYSSPYAASQVKNAKAAGLKVSAYHYSWFKTDSQARAEADYFANFARKVGLDNSTVMVNDIEEPQIAGLANHTANSISFENRLKELGFQNVRHYSSLSWLNAGYLNQQALGQKKIWVAAYPYTIPNTNYYTQYSSWQWNSRLRFPEIANKEFDISADYTNSFTQPANSLLSYTSHVQSKGWMNFVSDNSISGTVDEGKRMEALRLTLSNSLIGDIEYRSHVQGSGWEDNWNKNGNTSGTVGQGKRIEALQIRLTGEVANNYDIYYRVHSQFFGWMNWAKNGESAGTEGFSYRLEAYQVQLVPKGQSGPAGSGRKFVKYQDAVVQYQTHIQKVGWQTPVGNNHVSGTIGKGLRIEAMRLKVSNNPLAFPGKLEYQTHNQGIGWQGWKSSNELSGTEGQGLRTEAIQIRLTGEMAVHYQVYYRAHCQTYGWMGWAKNGEVAGTTGKNKRMEAIQVVIVSRNGVPPTSNSNTLIE